MTVDKRPERTCKGRGGLGIVGELPAEEPYLLPMRLLEAGDAKVVLVMMAHWGYCCDAD